MAESDHGNSAKLLRVQADVARHVVEALKVLGRAREEGVNVSSIFSQFFTDDVCKVCMSTLAPAVEASPSTSASASSSTLCDDSLPGSSRESSTPDSSPEVEGNCEGKRSMEENTDPEQDPDDINRRAKLESDKRGKEIQEWERILPALTEAYQKYQRKIRDGRRISRFHPSALCLESDCQKYEKSVCCFNKDNYSNINIKYCACEDLNYALVANGFFPASPSMAIIAIAAEVLDLAEGVCNDDVESVSRLPLDVYGGGGVLLSVDHKGDPLVEKFQDAFTSALPWYRQLKLQGLINSEA